MISDSQLRSISASGLSAWRGDRCLFRDLSLEVAAGSALLVRGDNGSGKTTLLRMLAGLGIPDEGVVTIDGISVRDADSRTCIGWCGHLPGLKADLSVAENLRVGAQLAGTGLAPEQALRHFALQSLMPLPVRALSAGQRRRVALSIVLSSGKPVWILDEPNTHLDDHARRIVANLVSDHVESGGIAVIATHGPVHLVTNRIQEHVMENPDA